MNKKLYVDLLHWPFCFTTGNLYPAMFLLSETPVDAFAVL
jgi:hypothetical protein